MLEKDSYQNAKDVVKNNLLSKVFLIIFLLLIAYFVFSVIRDFSSGNWLGATAWILFIGLCFYVDFLITKYKKQGKNGIFSIGKWKNKEK